MGIGPGNRCTGQRARAGRATAVALVVIAGALVPVAAGATTVASRHVTSPHVTGAKNAKLSPRLSAIAATPPRAALPRASALSLPRTGIGSLIRRADGKVLVEIRTNDTSAAAVARLHAAGAQIVNVSPAYSTITAAVAPTSLREVAADAAVRHVGEVLAPRVASGRSAARGSIRAPQPSGVATASAECGSTTSEGDTLMNVAAARAAHNLDGTGETVGILSDSFNTAAGSATNAQTDVSTGDLPGPGNPCGRTTPVVVQADYSGGGQADEGRGMAQLVHDLAPGANLAFATAFNGELDFASQINKLRTVNHASVIVDDVSYLDEPFFQNGPIANAANLATQSGVPYFSAAGNDNVVVGGNNVSSYEAPTFRSTPCPAAVLSIEPLAGGCHNFDAGGGTDNGDGITLAPGGGFGLDLQWAQPLGGVGTDYDFFVVDQFDNVVAAGTDDNIASGDPFEFAGYTNTTGAQQTVRIVIGKYSNGTPDARLKFVLTGADGITAVGHNLSVDGDIVGPSIFGHNGSDLVGSTAAIPFDNSNAPEWYSSRGPVTLYLNDAPSLTPLSSPRVLDKPDFAATDGVQTTFFAQQAGSTWRFYGTSAAAPQAAAVAALIEQDDPTLSATDVLATMHDTADPVATNGTPSDVGGGYIDALNALAGLVSMPAAPVAVNASAGNGQATVSWTAAPSNPNFPITSYTVTPYVGGVAQTPQPFASGATNEAVTGLTNGTAYTFTVDATNDNGTSGESGASPAVTIGTPLPPTVTTSTPGNAKAIVRWTAPASNNGMPVTGYVVTPFIGSVARPSQTFAGPATMQTVTGLINGIDYTFRIAAVNANGTGAFGAAGGLVVVGTPIPPTTPTAAPGNGTATIKWLAPATTNGSAVTRYLVTPYRAGIAQPVHSFTASPLTQTIAGLVNGAPYAFRVAAVNSHGTGPLSAASTTVIVGSPAAPTGLHATPGPGRVSLHWTAPSTGNGAAITGYVVSVRIAGIVQKTVTFSSPAVTQTVTGLLGGKTYTFTVAAKNSRGTGAPSLASNPAQPT